MVTEPESLLVANDHAILQTMLDEQGRAQNAFARLLRHKLRHCAVAPVRDVAPDVIRLGSRVSYRIDGCDAGPHVLKQAGASDSSGETLSIDTILGLALLGLPQGAVITFDPGNGVTRSLEVTEVLSPAQADIEPGQSACATPDSRETGAILTFRPRVAVARHPGSDDDDPGPSAA